LDREHHRPEHGQFCARSGKEETLSDSPEVRRSCSMIKDGFDVLTYRKGRSRRINERCFIRRRAEFDGRRVDYLLHDQPVRFLKGKLRLRQITRCGQPIGNGTKSRRLMTFPQAARPNPTFPTRGKK
jgi:hypothetical protein